MLIGPVTGVFVGLAAPAGAAVAFATFGDDQDFLFIGTLIAIALAIGGAVFGLFYAAAMALLCNVIDRTPRPRIHFWVAVASSFGVTFGLVEVSHYRSDLIWINPIVVTICLSFVTGIVTSKQSGSKSPEL